LTRRPDTRFGWFWIARLGPAALAGLGLPVVLAIVPARAQILGSQTPGTPGALDGELRSTRAPADATTSRAPALRGADADEETPARPAKFGVRRNANTAAKRTLNSGQTRNSGFPGASPSGAVLSQPGVSVRRPRDLTGAKFGNAADANASTPPLGRPSVPVGVAPGLPPVAEARPRRAVREDDPYAALGIRAGSMILRPAIDVGGGYDTNAARSGVNRKGSAFHRTELELTGTSDWSRHQLDLGLRGSYTGYSSLANANRPEGDARLALRLDVTRDLTLDAILTERIDTESPSSVNLPGGATKRTPFYTTGAALGATQRFGRLSVALRGTLDRSDYSDVESGGVNVSQKARNFTAYGLRLRTGYEITPGITPFAEALIDRRIHDLAVDAGGYARDSSGMTIRAGSSFELARNLTGEASAGYTFRAYEDARLAYLRAPAVDAALTWSISPLTTLNVRAQSEISETTIANSAGARVYRGTATLTHAFLRNFIATATLGFSRTDYDAVTRRENSLTSGLRLEYKFNRMLAVRGSYAFERLNVNNAGESYNSHTFMLGMRYTP
jgi:hypothetical protein